MTGQNQAPLSSTSTSPPHATTEEEQSLSTLQRIHVPQIPDQTLLQEAYNEGARDMQGRMEVEVERRVRDQLSLRARVQSSNEREAKAKQEYENYENRLNKSLASEDEQSQQLNSYVEALFDRQDSTPARPLACTAERTSCLQCYQDSANKTSLPLDCASKVDAFVKCADGLREEYVSRGMPPAP